MSDPLAEVIRKAFTDAVIANPESLPTHRFVADAVRGWLLSVLDNPQTAETVAVAIREHLIRTTIAPSGPFSPGIGASEHEIAGVALVEVKEQLTGDNA